MRKKDTQACLFTPLQGNLKMFTFSVKILNKNDLLTAQQKSSQFLRNGNRLQKKGLC